MTPIKHSYPLKKIIFVEISTGKRVSVDCAAEVNQLGGLTLKRMLLKKHIPPRIGDLEIDSSNIDKLGNSDLGGWLQALYPHIAGLYPCSYLRLDVERLGDSLDLLEEEINGESSLVLISSVSSHLFFVQKIIQGVRSRGVPALFTIGGRHATINPEETKEVTGADIVVCGEADHFFRTFISAAMEGKSFSPKSILNQHETTPTSPSFCKVEDRLHSWHFYLQNSNSISSYLPRLTIDRFCPHSCGFCSRLISRQAMPSIAPKVISWLDKYINAIGLLCHIHTEIDDPDFIFLAAANFGLLDYLSSQQLTWAAMCRVQKITPELREALSAVREAGCLRLFVGIESFQQNVLDVIKKRVNSSSIIPWLSAIKESDLGTHINIIIGLPGQTPENVDDDIRLVVSLIKDGIVDVVTASFLILYPGTRFRINADKFGITIFDKDYSALEMEVQHHTSLMSKDQIISVYRDSLEKLINVM